MVRTEIYFTDDLYIATDLVAIPKAGDRVVFWDFEASQLSDDGFIKEMADYINKHEEFELVCDHYPISTNRPIQDYRHEVLKALLLYKGWRVEQTAIGTNRLYVWLYI